MSDATGSSSLGLALVPSLISIVGAILAFGGAILGTKLASRSNKEIAEQSERATMVEMAYRELVQGKPEEQLRALRLLSVVHSSVAFDYARAIGSDASISQDVRSEAFELAAAAVDYPALIGYRIDLHGSEEDPAVDGYLNDVEWFLRRMGLTNLRRDSLERVEPEPAIRITYGSDIDMPAVRALMTLLKAHEPLVRPEPAHYHRSSYGYIAFKVSSQGMEELLRRIREDESTHSYRSHWMIGIR